MTPRVQGKWHEEEAGILDPTFEAIAVNWSREKKEELLQTIGQAFFPKRDKELMWRCLDRTKDTKDNVPFYQVFIRHHASPSAWFKNLRLLQLRVKLQLEATYYMRNELGVCLISEVVNKLDALRAIIGDAKLNEHKTPELKKPSARRDYPSIQSIRADSLHRAKIRARAAEQN